MDIAAAVIVGIAIGMAAARLWWNSALTRLRNLEALERERLKGILRRASVAGAPIKDH